MADYMSISDGAWFDHESNEWILTLDSKRAGLLQVGLVLFVGYLSFRFGKLFSFVLHQLLAHGQPRSVLAAQISLSIRIAGDLLGVTTGLASLAWRWKSKARSVSKAFVLVLLVISLAFTLLVAWQVAQFSLSLIWTRAGQQELLEPRSSCGYLDLDNMNTKEAWDAFKTASLEDAALAQTIIDQHSTDDISGVSAMFPRSALQFNTTSTPCFLAEDAFCIKTNSTPIAMDTGYMHSSRDLGINFSDSDSIELRRVTTCSPVDNTPFTTFLNADNTKYAAHYPPKTRFQLFHYGALPELDQMLHLEHDVTFIYSEWTSYFPFGFTVRSITNGALGDWRPSSEFFNREDAEVSIFFITPNHVRFEQPVYDPVFSATTPEKFPAFNSHTTYYLPSYLVNTVACMDQYQICNPTKSENCTPLGPSQHLLVHAYEPSISLNNKQLAIAKVLSEILPLLPISSASDGRDSSALLATRTTYGDVSVGLPKGHWQEEYKNLFLIQLIRLRLAMIQYASGPRDRRLTPYLTVPYTQSLEDVCKSQRVSMTGPLHSKQNFLLVPIIIIAVMGTWLIVLSLSLESATGRLCGKQNCLGHHRWMAWVLDSPYNMHRRIHEHNGLVFEKCDHNVPISSDRVPANDLQDPQGPTAGQQVTIVLDEATPPGRFSSDARSSLHYESPQHCQVDSHGDERLPTIPSRTASVSSRRQGLVAGSRSGSSLHPHHHQARTISTPSLRLIPPDDDPEQASSSGSSPVSHHLVVPDAPFDEHFF